MQLNKNYKLDKIVKTDNFAEDLTEEDRSAIATYCFEGYLIDAMSRTDWEARNADSMKLAMQISEKKTFPWPGAANVKFPLVSVAALQWHARAYPILVPGTRIVEMQVFGDDPEGKLLDRSKRIGAHMSWQVSVEDKCWEEHMDKVLIHAPIVGCSFKKTYYNVLKGHNESQFVPASALVVNYYATSLENASRVTHVISLSRNEVYERMAAGRFCKTDITQTTTPTQNLMDIAKDKGQGQVMPGDDPMSPIEILEQHTFLDLDGDGYAEPYIVTLRRDTKELLRLEARFYSSGIEYTKKGDVLRIVPEQYFTKFPFIPSPDGGFYDMGFGSLLGPVNNSVSTLINQLLDAGTMANLAGGFISRGIKIRSGNMTFAPLEWKPVESTGDDLRKGIFPMPVREPSKVLLELLSLLINYGERIGMSVDILSGENPGQNTPAETTRTMAEQGLKIFNGVYKRTWRALKSEFEKLYRLNRIYLPENSKFGNGVIIRAIDYADDYNTIVPAADPHVTDAQQRQDIATMIKQSAMTTPGYNRFAVEKNWLEALQVQNIDELLPDPKGPNAAPPLPNPKVEIEKMKAEQKKQAAEATAKIKAAELQLAAQKQQAEVDKLQAETIKLMKEAGSTDVKNQIELLKIKLQAHESQRDVMLQAAKLMIDMHGAETDRMEAENAANKPAASE